ncbi:unnamed protein product [Camellia sinensis]
MAISPTNSFTAHPPIISGAFKFASDCNLSESSTLLCNFLRQEGVQSIDARDNTLLHFLTMYGNLSAFQMLLVDGILMNEELTIGNKNGDTTLHEAARFGQKEIVEVLLEYEGDLVMNVFDLLIKDGRIHSDHSVMARTTVSFVLHAAIMGDYFSIPSMVYGWKHAGDEENQHQNGHNISKLGHLATKLISG